MARGVSPVGTWQPRFHLHNTVSNQQHGDQPIRLEMCCLERQEIITISVVNYKGLVNYYRTLCKPQYINIMLIMTILIILIPIIRMIVIIP